VIRRLAYSALALQVVLVVTGTAVRVTGSGLGCPTWPRCTGGSLTNTAELGAHGFIEFGNRLLAVVMEAIGIALVWTVWNRRPELRRLALVQAAVVPLQALIGGLLVLSDLNPYVLIVHFLTSFPLVFAAAALLHRVIGGEAPHALAGRLATAVLGAVCLVLVLGTLVTGTGPHAGDPKVDRLPFNPRELTQLHADAAYLLCGLVVALVLVGHLRRWTLLLLGLVIAQGTVGYVQYFNGVPPVLVGIHVALATLTFTTGAWLLLRSRSPARTAAPTPARAAGTATAR
jgi:cytochrome c oxidase assembly protein subunit 15